MITHENITYQDESELIYQFLKQGKNLGEICNAIKTYLPELMFWERRVKNHMIRCITEDSWLYNRPFEFFEFISMFITAFTTCPLFGKFIIEWIGTHQDYVFEYKEEYKQHIETVLNKKTHDFYDDNLLNLLLICQNYLSKDLIMDLYHNNNLKEEHLNQIIILNKIH